ncbi:MAG: serine hydrolase domain-containing protein [Chloroflexota bacterium]
MSKLNRYFRALEQQERFSGAVWISQGEFCLFAGAYGYASRSWKVKNELDTRFDTASITKLFTAVAALQLVDSGLLSLNTRVVEYLDLRDTALSPRVTLFHLLTHTSGIGDAAEEENGEQYEHLWKARPNYSVTCGADFLPQFVHKPANFPPGAGCRYCNCGYILVGLAIEKASGMEYRDYVRRNIFSRAGMADTDFLRMDQVNPRAAEGSDPIRGEQDKIIGWKKNIYSFPPAGLPDSGAYATVADLDRFLRAVRRGALLSPPMTEAFMTPQVDYRACQNWDKRYGLGLWFYVERNGRIVCCQKEGINAGVSAVIRYFPAEDISVTILSNMKSGAWNPIWDIHNLIVSDQTDQNDPAE